MVHEPEDIEQRAEPFIRGAGLVEIGGEQFNAEPVGFVIPVGGRSPRFALWRQRGHPVALGLHLAFKSLGLLVRRPELVLEFGQPALEFATDRRGSRGAIGRLSPSVFELVPQGLQARALFSSFVLLVAMQAVELGPQLSSLLGQLFVASNRRRELNAVLLDRPGQPVRVSLMAGRLAAGGFGPLERDGQAIPIRAQGFDLPERDIALPDESLNLVSKPVGFAIAVGGRSPRFALWRQRGHPVALGLHLAFKSLGLLVRCPQPVLEFGQPALEFATDRRGSRGAIGRGGRLSASVFQLVPQGLQARALFSSFVLLVAMQAVELGPQLSSLLGQLFVESNRRRELNAVLLDRPGQPVRVSLMAGRLAAGGLGPLERDGQAIPIRVQGFDLPEREIALPDESLNLVSKPVGFAIAVGGRSPRFALWRQRGHPVVLGVHLAFESLGLLVRRPEPVLEFGQPALEFTTDRRGSRGAIGRLSPSVFQLVPQGLQARALFSSFVLLVAMQAVELGPQLSSLLGQLFVALESVCRELNAVLLDRPGQPVRVSLMAGRLAAGGLGPLERDGQAIPIRAQGFDLAESRIPLLDENLNLVSEPFGFLAEVREIPLEL